MGRGTCPRIRSPHGLNSFWVHSRGRVGRTCASALVARDSSSCGSGRLELKSESVASQGVTSGTRPREVTLPRPARDRVSRERRTISALASAKPAVVVTYESDRPRSVRLTRSSRHRVNRRRGRPGDAPVLPGCSGTVSGPCDPASRRNPGSAGRFPSRRRRPPGPSPR